MTIIEAPDVYDIVDAPPARAHRYGLFSVVTFDTMSAHQGWGLTWESDACISTEVTYNPCIDEVQGIIPLIVGDDCPAQVESKPFTVYTYQGLSGGGDSDDFFTARAKAKLANGEQYGAERGFTAALKVAVPAPVLVTTPFPGSTALFGGTVVGALGYVEEEVGAMVEGEGVIVMSAVAATYLAQYLHAEGTVMRTIRGTPVIITSAMLAAERDTIYGVGQIAGRRGAVETLVGFDHATNTSLVIASRDYVIAWDCGAVGATFVL